MRLNPARRVALFTLAVAMGFVAAAWTTELRGVLHGGLITLCVFAFLPFVAIATVLCLMCVVGIILGFAGADGAHASDLAGFAEALLYAPRGIRGYYRFLARHRRSVWIGLPAGLLFGALVVWLLLALLVIPRELRTAQLLEQLRVEAEQAYKSTRNYPKSVDVNYYPSSMNAPVLDDFGQPLHYEVQSKWLAKSYRITSYGADGRPSSDDLCVQGENRVQKAIEVSAALASLGETILYFETGIPLRDRLGALRSLQCQHGELKPGASK